MHTIKSFRDLNRQIIVPNVLDFSVTVSVSVTGEKHDACSYRRKLKTTF